MKTSNSKEGKLEEWKRIIDSTSDLVSVHDSDFNIVVANKAFADVAGFPLSEIIGRKCYDVIHGSGEPPSRCPHRQALLTNSPITEDFYEARLGKHLLVSVSPISDEKQQVIGSLHIVKDVTERENEVAELQKHRDRLEELMSTRTIELIKAHEQLKKEMEERRRAEEAVENRDRILGEALRIAKLSSYEWDMATGEVVGSDEGYRIVGLPVGSSVSFSQVVDLIHPDDRAALLSSIERAIKTPQGPTEIECRITRQDDGQERYVEIKGEVSFEEVLAVIPLVLRHRVEPATLSEILKDLELRKVAGSQAKPPAPPGDKDQEKNGGMTEAEGRGPGAGELGAAGGKAPWRPQERKPDPREGGASFPPGSPPAGRPVSWFERLVERYRSASARSRSSRVAGVGGTAMTAQARRLPDPGTLPPASPPDCARRISAIGWEELVVPPEWKDSPQ